MSEPPSEREWRFYLDDMIGFASRVIEYTEGLDQAGFEATQWPTMRPFATWNSSAKPPLDPRRVTERYEQIFIKFNNIKLTLKFQSNP